MADQWYVLWEGKQRGPATLDQFRQFVAAGRLKLDDLVWKAGMQGWVKAATIQGLFPAAPKQSGPPLAPSTAVPPPTAQHAPLPVTGTTPYPLSLVTVQERATAGRIPPVHIALALAVCCPVGLYFVWQHPRWLPKQKWIWTGTWSGLVILGLIVMPAMIIGMNLLTGFAVTFLLIWSQPRLTLRQRKIGLTMFAGLCIACICGVFFYLNTGLDEIDKNWQNTALRKGVAVWSLAYSPDGKLLATAGSEGLKTNERGVHGSVCVWNARTGALLATMWEEALGDSSGSGMGLSTQCLAFSFDSTLLAFVVSDTLRIWNVGTKKEVLTIRVPNCLSVSFSPNGKHIAAGCFPSPDHRDAQRIPDYHPMESEGIRIWNIATGARVVDFVGHKHSVTSISFSEDGQYLASCCAVPFDYTDGEIKIWEVATGKEKRGTVLAGTLPHCVTFSPNNKQLAIACGRWDGSAFRGCEIKLLDVDSLRERLSLSGLDSTVRSIAYSPDGTRLVSGGGNSSSYGSPGELKVWDARKGKLLLNLSGHTNCVNCVRFSPKGTIIVSASGGSDIISGWTKKCSGEVKVWRSSSGQEVGNLAWKKPDE